MTEEYEWFMGRNHIFPTFQNDRIKVSKTLYDYPVYLYTELTIVIKHLLY